jgi:hypothetical protein
MIDKLQREEYNESKEKDAGGLL